MIQYIITLFLLTTFSFGEFNYHLRTHDITKDIKCFFGLQKEASQINGANVINTCYIETKEGYVVIDSGPTYSYAQQAYKVIQDKKVLPIKYVINTSNKELNSLGNAFYEERGAVIIGAKVDTKAKKQNIFLENQISKEAFENTYSVPLHISLTKDKEITLGSTKIKIKKFENKLVVHIPNSKTIFVGDFVSDNPSKIKNQHNSIKKWAKTFNIIEKLSWKYIISSHSIKRKRYALANTKNYLKLFQEKPKHKVEKEKLFIVKKTEPTPLIVAIKEENKKLKHTPCIQYTDLKQAKKSALKEHKYVMIKVEADNCRPCQKLNKLLKTNTRIKKIVNKYVKSVKINRDHESVPSPYDDVVTVAPTVLLVNPKTNQVLVQLEGDETTDDLYESIKLFVADSIIVSR